MLDPRLLRAFVAIADAGSFTAAADRLHMTQSTMSQQIARLEDAIGRALVDRAARPVRLTVTGERLLGHARRILALQDEALTLVAETSGTTSVRIGMPDDIADSIVFFCAEGAQHITGEFLITDAGLHLSLTPLTPR